MMFMAGDVAEAKQGSEAGADVIIAQGTEGGGHVNGDYHPAVVLDLHYTVLMPRRG